MMLNKIIIQWLWVDVAIKALLNVFYLLNSKNLKGLFSKFLILTDHWSIIYEMVIFNMKESKQISY